MSASAESGEKTPVRLSVQPEPSSDYPVTYPQQSGLDRPGALYSSRLEANSYRERDAQYSTIAGSGVYAGIQTGSMMHTASRVSIGGSGVHAGIQTGSVMPTASGLTSVSEVHSHRLLEHGKVSPLAGTSISTLPTTVLGTDAVTTVTQQTHVGVPSAGHVSRSTIPVTVSHASTPTAASTQRTMLQHASAVLSDMTTADIQRVAHQAAADSNHCVVSSHQTKETRTQGLPKELIADAKASLERLDRVTDANACVERLDRVTEGVSTIRSKSAPPRSFEGFQLAADGVYEKITYIDKERVEENITRRPLKTVEERVRYITKETEEADVEVEIEEKINYVSVKQVVERPKEVIRHVAVEQVVEVEQIVEVPGELVEREKPYLVEEQVIVPRYIDQEVHTVVSQRMQPVIVEASEEDDCYLDVKCRVYNMQTEAVDIFVPLPVQRVLFAAVKHEEHREIPRHLLPPEHYNGLVRDLNAHLPLEDTLALFLMDKSMAHLLVNKQFINLEDVGAIPCTSGPGTEFVPVPEGVTVLPCSAAPSHPSLAAKIYSGAYPTKDDWLQACQKHIQQMEAGRTNSKAVQGAEHSYGPYNYAFQPYGMFDPSKGGPFHVHHHLAPEKLKEETSSSVTTEVKQQVEVVRTRETQRPTKIRGSRERRRRRPPSTSFESESFSPSQSTSSTICSPNLMPRSRKHRRSSSSSAPRRRHRRRTPVHDPRKKPFSGQRTGKSTSTLVEDAMSFIEGLRK
ncbi:MAG: hypothetical protein KVP17_002414 [Porospora cf. gigantea B]|uniref:uncharacterized protein n=1 Tax=Porospora cf. gigantea B TaxID=2853592 RepID=UPI003571E37C|nr:MAG: hypothetical protein KVP17_002414 [Porospora cf. gigantea B]